MFLVGLLVDELRPVKALPPRVCSHSQNSSPRDPIFDFQIKPRHTKKESGFTLIELMVAIALMSILFALTTGALTYYFSGKSVDTAASEITSQIREAQSLAVATGNTYRIDFSDPTRSSYTLQRRSGNAWINVRDSIRLPGGVTFSSSMPPSFGNDSYLEFYSRGTAEDGQVTLTGRFNESKTIRVDGETVNVQQQ